MTDIEPSKALRRLASMGLPADYGTLNHKSRRSARLKALRAWFDPDPARSHVLCTDTEAFIRAHKLWVEFYIKPDPRNAGIYHFTDPLHKYEMVRMAMSPARTQNQAAKSACVAPRRSTKTITLIQEMCSMIAAVRTTPVQILISEMNAPRTSEEIRNLRSQFEQNELIQADFGGAGVLFPRGRSGGERWNDSTLCFQHTRSIIMGYSISSAQRGRHPTLGIIDDPEDEDLSHNPEWRRKYFRWLFKTYCPMFGPGGHIMWIGTLIHEFSCLQMAMLGSREIRRESDDEPEIERDERFDDWNRKVFAMIEQDPETGRQWSIFPDYMSVEDFDRYKTTHGLSAAMAEFQGLCIAADQFCFQRDSHRHGYMHCVRENGEEYMLDLKSGVRMPWELFLSSLHIVGAGDLSDSMAISADPGALVFIGANAAGVIYVLDVWTRRCHADDLVQRGYEMAMQLKAEKIGWEKAAMQSVVVRYAQHYGDQLRREGHVVPIHRGIVNNQQDKTRRILAALRPLLGDDQIRFLHLEAVSGVDGEAHRSAKCGHARYHRLLKEQVDGFTDEGASGHDDAIDALEMAIRLLGRSRGTGVGGDDGDAEAVRSIELWAEVGMVWPRHKIPMPCWTNEMRKQAVEPEHAYADSEMDPYE